MRQVDIFIESKGCGDRWRLYVEGVLPSCYRAIVDALEGQGETVLVTATPGRSGLGRHVYQTPAPEVVTACLCGSARPGQWTAGVHHGAHHCARVVTAGLP